MFLVLPQSLIPLLNYTYINVFCIRSESELLKWVYVLVFQEITCLKHADIIRPILVKTLQSVGETLVLLAEQLRNTGATG
jgi:hypothetical protein